MSESLGILQKAQAFNDPTTIFINKNDFSYNQSLLLCTEFIFFGSKMIHTAIFRTKSHLLQLLCVKEVFRSSSDLLSNSSLFGGQIISNHEHAAQVIYLLTTD